MRNKSKHLESVRNPRQENHATERVGTELSKLIPDWAVEDRSGCRCKSWISKMDKWGTEKCTSNREAIIDHLVESKEFLIPALRVLPDCVCRVAAGKMLDKAIRNAGGQGS